MRIMLTNFRLLFGAAAVGAAAFLIGCNEPVPTAKDTSGTTAGSGTQESESESESDRQEIEKNLTELSKDDRALAEAQEFCPVSGEKLGSMGVPIKVEAKGETVFLCCKGCKKEFDADPDKFLAKVEELKKENAAKVKSRDERVHDVPPSTEPQN